MKTRKPILAGLIIIALFWGFNRIVQSQEKAEQLFEKALYTEETKGELLEAIDIYKEVVDLQEAEANLKARALLRIGMCYEKLGKNEAINAYELILDKYSAQKEQAAEARIRLSELTMDKPSHMTIKPMRFGVPEPFELSPDGSKILGVRFDKGQNVVVSHLDQRKIDFITNYEWTSEEYYWTYNPIWSPDGDEIAYLESYEGKEGIHNYRISISDLTGNSRVLINSSTIKYIPNAWMPDGSSILTIIEKDNSQSIGLVDIKSGKFRELADLGGVVESFGRSRATACPSPDGKFIVYTGRISQGNTDIFVINSSGGEPYPFAGHPAFDKWPRWSPDGKHIIFLSNRHGNEAFWGIEVREGKPVDNPFFIRDGMGNNFYVNWTKFGLVSWYWVRMLDIHLLDINPVTGEPVGQPHQLDYPQTGVNVFPAFSPKGNDIAFYKTDLVQSKFYLVITQGSEDKVKEYEIPAGIEPQMINWTPDSLGIGVLAPGKEGPSINIFNIDNEEWESFNLPSSVGTNWTRVEWTGKGREIFYGINGLPGDGAGIAKYDPDSGENIYVYRPDGTSRTNYRGLVCSHDYTKLYFRENNTRSTILDLKTGEKRVLDTRISGFPAWSPDDQKIMWIGQDESNDNKYALFVMPVSSDKPQKYDLSRYFQGNFRINRFDWSADGSKVVFGVMKGRSEHMLYQNIIPADKR